MTLKWAPNSNRISPGSEHVHLRLLATTDLHAHLLPFDYYTARPDAGTGLARLAGLIATARAEAPNTLLFDNGDTLEGTPLADTILSDTLPSGAPNPMIAAMNALGYDAATLGNHDFDFGLDYLQTSLVSADFPWVSANIHDKTGHPFVPPHHMLTRTFHDGAGRAQTLRIGVTGAAPPQIAIWSKRHVAGHLTFSDIVDAISAQTRALREDGADLVIALCHSGLGHAFPPGGSENVSLQVASECGVDVVVAGHTHDLVATCTTGGGVPIVQPAAFGSHLGLIDLLLTPETDHWGVEATQVTTLAPSEMPPCRTLTRPFPKLCAQVAAAHRLTRTRVDAPLGRSAKPIHTLCSPLAPGAATQLIADAQRTAATPLLAARPDLAGLPVLSAAAPFRAGGRAGPSNYTDIPTGELKLRHAADLYVYPNTLNVLRINGVQLRNWLEHCVSIYRRIDPSANAPQPLIDHAFAAYKFDRITGLRYRIDVSQPPRTDAEGAVINPSSNRVRDLCFASGVPLGDDDDMLVITNSYRAAGGGHILPPDADDPILTSGQSIRETIAHYISASDDCVDISVDPSFSFTPLGGTQVVFETGPGALDHPDALADLGLRPTANALNGAGFLVLEMQL
jgi:2',3'-cyclic-nucleotide 2'-phosphodiesterase/3'-nucleotidase